VPAAPRPRVLIHVQKPQYGLTAEDVAVLAREIPEAEIAAAEEQDLLPEIPAAEAFAGFPNAELIRAGKKLRWIHVHSAGVEYYAIPEVVEGPLTLTSAKIIQGPEIADHALALLLALTRRLHEIIPRREHEEYARSRYQPIELQRKTAVIIGLGGIGVQIAERAAAFGMRVLAVDPKDVPYLRAVERCEKPDRLHDLLPAADVLFVAAPLTPETRKMLGAEELALLRRGAYFINVSRGELVDTDALAAALARGHLAGAGLDVTDPEPLPKGHALWKMENVIITPHIAGVSDHIHERRLALVKENIQRFVRGLPLRNVVDKAKGY
jgi:phosphoglycerate dehydrogenase-like enzyme